MAGLNLLPWREKEREAKKKQFFSLVGGTLVGAASLVFLGNLYMNSLLEYQQSRNQLLETEIAGLDQKIKQIEDLDKTRQALLDRIKVIESLQSTRPAIVHLLDEMVNALPKGMYLLHLQQKGTLVQLEGKAESYARVSSYMKQLDASPWLNSSNLNTITTDSKVAEKDDQLMLRDFKLDVTQLLTQGGEENKVATEAKLGGGS
jgi:type IV pilus assembly protein PilN